MALPVVEVQRWRAAAAAVPPAECLEASTAASPEGPGAAAMTVCLAVAALEGFRVVWMADPRAACPAGWTAAFPGESQVALRGAYPAAWLAAPLAACPEACREASWAELTAVCRADRWAAWWVVVRRGDPEAVYQEAPPAGFLRRTAARGRIHPKGKGLVRRRWRPE
ncbi:MAG TPA: hypothetical protein PLF84_00895 [Bryobacteraceae bacterium]|nr:hypothetical protein [Bryobacteraceae bacterium]